MQKIGIQYYAKNQYGRIVEEETRLCQYFRKEELSRQIFEALQSVFNTFPLLETKSAVGKH